MQNIIYIVLVFTNTFLRRNKCRKIDSFKELLHDFSYAHAVVIFDQRRFSRPSNSSKIFSIFRKTFFHYIFSFNKKIAKFALVPSCICNVRCNLFWRGCIKQKGGFIDNNMLWLFHTNSQVIHISYKYSYWVSNKKSINVLRFHL